MADDGRRWQTMADDGRQEAPVFRFLQNTKKNEAIINILLIELTFKVLGSSGTVYSLDSHIHCMGVYVCACVCVCVCVRVLAVGKSTYVSDFHVLRSYYKTALSLKLTHLSLLLFIISSGREMLSVSITSLSIKSLS